MAAENNTVINDFMFKVLGLKDLAVAAKTIERVGSSAANAVKPIDAVQKGISKVSSRLGSLKDAGKTAEDVLGDMSVKGTAANALKTLKQEIGKQPQIYRDVAREIVGAQNAHDKEMDRARKKDEAATVRHNQKIKEANEWLADTFSKMDSKVNAATQASRALKENQELLRKVMKDTGTESKRAKEIIGQMGVTMDKMKGPIDAFGKKFEYSAKAARKAARDTERFKMHMLSVLFLAMSLQRALIGLGRAAVTTFQTARGDIQGLGESTWHLQAAWEFLKYSIVDAVTQSSIFKIFVDTLLAIVNWLNKLSPQTKVLIGIAFALSLVGTFAIFVIAQLSLMTAAGWMAFGIIAVGAIGAVIAFGLILSIIEDIRKLVTLWGEDWEGFFETLTRALLKLVVLVGVVGATISLSLLIAGKTAAAGGVIMWTAWTAGLILVVAAVAWAVYIIIKDFEYFAYVFKTMWYTFAYVVKVIASEIWQAIKVVFYGIAGTILTVMGYTTGKVVGMVVDAVSKIVGLLSKLPFVGEMFDGMSKSLKEVSTWLKNSGKAAQEWTAQGIADSISDGNAFRTEALEEYTKKMWDAEQAMSAVVNKQKQLPSTVGVSPTIPQTAPTSLEEIQKSAGLTTEQRTFIDNSNKTYNINMPQSNDPQAMARYFLDEVNNEENRRIDSSIN